MAIIVPILSQFNDSGVKAAVREFKKAQTSLGKFGAVGKIFDSVGKSLTKNVTVPLAAAAAGIYKATQAASTLEESLSKTNAVFGDNARAIIEWSKDSATAFGSSQQQALEAVSTYGNLFQAFGLSREQAGEFSTTMVQLAGDLSSFNNVPIEDVFTSLRSGLSGETEPLKKFGVALSDQRLRLKAMELGLGEYTGILPIAVKSQAAYALILEDTQLAQGDYLRTSNSLANQQRTLQAETQNLVAEFGTAFLPIMKRIVGSIRDNVVPQLKRFSDFVRGLSPETLDMVVKIGAFVAILGPLFIVIGKVIGAIKLFIGVFKLLNLAFFLSPIGLVVLAIGALIAAFIMANRKSEPFRDAMIKIGNVLISNLEFSINVVITAINILIDTFNLLVRGANALGGNLEEISKLGTVSITRLSKSTKVLTQDIDAMSDYALALAGIGRGELTPEIENMGDAMAGATGNGGTSKKAEKLKEALKQLQQAAVDAAQKIVNNLQDSLRSAESQLDSARSAFNNFKDAIKGTISGILNFGEAADESDFLVGLMEQAADATSFADKVKQLITLGLSERGIQQVLGAGFEAGTKIADQLIAGGATVINQVNEIISAVDAIAEATGIIGAEEFYNAGVMQGEALVNGILTALRDAQATLAEAQRSAASGATILGYEGLGSRATSLFDKIGTISNPAKQKQALADFAKALEQSKGKPAISTGERDAITKKYRLAKGGIVTGPTNALIGEAGPEAVIPLTGSKSGSMGTTYNITVNAGVGTDGQNVGRQIVEAIKKYERASGQVFARA